MLGFPSRLPPGPAGSIIYVCFKEPAERELGYFLVTLPMLARAELTVGETLEQAD